MAQVKSGTRLYTLLFCIAVFFLTSVGLAVLSYGMLPASFFFIFILVYVTAWALLFASAVDFLDGKGKFSGKKAFVLAFGVMLVSALFTHLVWTITTPKWSFSVSTDRSTYRLGEPVTITASLRNLGFITHSFRSASSNPVVVSVEYQSTANSMSYQVWYSSISRSATEFSAGPGETLERNFSWNQTNTVNPGLWNQTYMPGTYWVLAFVPKDTAQTFGFDNFFFARTNMNITST
jgi:hypothetical protein